MRSYANLIPATCSDISVERLNSAVKELDDLSAGTKRTYLLSNKKISVA